MEPRISSNDGANDGGEEANDREGEACAQAWEERECGPQADALQYCGEVAAGSEELVWGVCLEEPECVPGESGSCEGDGSRRCEVIDGEPTWGECLENGGDEAGGEGEEITPLVVAFSDDAVALDAAGTAAFEISGECLGLDWPTAATPWLALDLDESGSIDDGRELFGTGTTLATGARARHGFAALAELDENGDGVIGPADPRFADLLLWSDHDGDRRSTHAEHETLASRGIVAIPLAYRSVRECDARGNCAIERVEAATREPGATARVIDIHLACQ
jgi:hypothetical protein